MNRVLKAGLLTATVLVTGPALAQTMIKCVDDKGKVYYGQTMPKECLGKSSQEMNRAGMVVKRNETLTAEQLAAIEEQKKKKAEEDALAREERRKNQALLNTYSSEKDIEEARSRSLRENELSIKDIEKRMSAGQKRHKDLENEKEFYAKKTLPPKLAQDLKNNEIEMGSQQDLLEAKKKQVEIINAKYDEDKRRYVELTKGKTSGAPQAATRR
jgi:flagellar biosynthesis GTPase FlhF